MVPREGKGLVRHQRPLFGLRRSLPLGRRLIQGPECVRVAAPVNDFHCAATGLGSVRRRWGRGSSGHD